MVEIDRGTAASGLTLLAECALTRGDRAGSRRLFERARDAHGWDSALQVPKALSVVQKALRGGGGRLAVVDLPRVLEELSGELPGRRAFLDYCHLTSWGIRAAMAAAAGPLLAAWGVSGADPEALRGHASAPEPRLEAEAHFAAAVHNAHWGQAYNVVRRLCDEALRQNPGIAEALRCYLDFLARRAPAWASRS
jgi:hypothetical protein